MQQAVTAPNCSRTDHKFAARPGLEPGTLRLQDERSPDWATKLPTNDPWVQGIKQQYHDF